ncbi:hypothetical protein HK102_002877, partial [Quaeritorhiza haematococci]
FSLITGEGMTSDLFNVKIFPISTNDSGDLLLHVGIPDPEIVSISNIELPASRRPKKSNSKSSEKATNAVSSESEIETGVGKLQIQQEKRTPTTLVDWAVEILETADPAEKVRLTLHVADLWRNGTIQKIMGSRVPPRFPPRQEGTQMLAPGKVKRLGKAGTLESRIAILHSLANIEQWAIDLAWDIIARFASYTPTYNPDGRVIGSCSSTSTPEPTPPSPSTQPQPQPNNNTQATVQDTPFLPPEFFGDFIKVAADEAKHYSLLVDRLSDMGSHFGALAVHGGLWDSAMETEHDLMCRLAIVHMVHEARGLDVNPQTIAKFAKAGDEVSVETLQTIHADEITHVATGQKWFTYLLSLSTFTPATREDPNGGDGIPSEHEQPSERRYKIFHDIVRNHFRGPLKPPFNDEDRLKAGLDKKFYLPLTRNEGEGVNRKQQQSQ